MSKSLSIIQTVFKVLKIICKVLFILCLVGGIGCAVGLLLLSLIPLASIGISEIITDEADMSIDSMCFACITGMVVCISEAVVLRFGEIYFTHELEAGTPFTYEGSKEVFRFGIISIIVPLAVSVFLGILYGFFYLISGDISNMDIDNSVSLGGGLTLIFASVIFKYGAEIINNDKETEEEQI